jgi:hypothetical protein
MHHHMSYQMHGLDVFLHRVKVIKNAYCSFYTRFRVRLEFFTRVKH